MVPSAVEGALRGRVAVVTGANKGIGYFIALQLALSGSFQHVLLGCRDAARAAQAVDRMQQQVLQEQEDAKVHISSAPLELGNEDSHAAFVKHIQEKFGRVDVLVNNAAFAFKNADPTPFREQCGPTLKVNFYGTVDLTNRMMGLLRAGADPRVVSVASMAGRLSQVSPALQAEFSSAALTMPSLFNLVQDFEASVMDGTHQSKGWGSSNYGMSKLAVIAATKVWARQEPSIKFYSCCPGYCQTDMTSQRGARDPADGARNAVIPATLSADKLPESGSYFADYQVAEW
jgi:carbonyl reductase 1